MDLQTIKSSFAKRIRDSELMVTLCCATAGEVFVYIAVLKLNYFQIEFPQNIRLPHEMELLSLAVAIPVAIFFGLVGSILFSSYRLNKNFGRNIEHLSKVNEILSREDKLPNKYLPYKTIVSNIFLGDKLSHKVTALTSGGLSVNTGEFASIIEFFLDNLEKNYNANVYIFSTCVLKPYQFMKDDLQAYRDKWEEFAKKFILKSVCPRFVRLILPDLLPTLDDDSRQASYDEWQQKLDEELTCYPPVVDSFIKWNKENCFKLYKLERPYPQNYYGVEFNPPPVNDFMIIAENCEGKRKGHVIIGGWIDYARTNHFYVKYEKEPARLELYCNYFDSLTRNSKEINKRDDLI